MVDVVDRMTASCSHVVEGQVPAGPTHGRIDWDRRFEHMQQHTGQHVLSAAFERVCQARTESFHLGSASATIDLAQEVSPAQIAAAELAANRVVWEDRPVSVRFVDESEAANLPLRKEPRRSGRLRIVEVDGFDLSACGGTHVSRTGAIGNISVGSFERFRGGTRVEFRCGIRALESYRLLRDTVSSAARLLSTGWRTFPRRRRGCKARTTKAAVEISTCRKSSPATRQTCWPSVLKTDRPPPSSKLWTAGMRTA